MLHRHGQSGARRPRAPTLRSRYPLRTHTFPYRSRGRSSRDRSPTGRAFRPLLEREYGIRFASEALADEFAFEAAYPIGKPFGFHGLFNFCRIVPPNELITLVRHFAPPIVRSPQLLQLGRNCIALGQWQAAAAIFRRILDEDANHAEAAAGLETATANAATLPAAGRNEPCPCGSGKRYKNCHGVLGGTTTRSAAAWLTPDQRVREALVLHKRGDT